MESLVNPLPPVGLESLHAATPAPLTSLASSDDADLDPDEVKGNVTLAAKVAEEAAAAAAAAAVAAPSGGGSSSSSKKKKRGKKKKRKSRRKR